MTNENEPNDVPGTANLVAYGSTISGTLSPDDMVDQYIFKVPSDQSGKSRLIVRLLSQGDYIIYITVWNDKDEQLFKQSLGGIQTLSAVVGASTLYLVEIRIVFYLKSDVIYQLVMSKETK